MSNFGKRHKCLDFFCYRLNIHCNLRRIICAYETNFELKWSFLSTSSCHSFCPLFTHYVLSTFTLVLVLIKMLFSFITMATEVKQHLLAIGFSCYYKRDLLSLVTMVRGKEGGFTRIYVSVAAGANTIGASCTASQENTKGSCTDTNAVCSATSSGKCVCKDGYVGIVGGGCSE